MGVELERRIRDAILGLSAVTAIVGSGDSARIRSDFITEDDTPPCVLIDVKNRNKVNDLSGRGGAMIASVAVTARETTRTKALALAEALRSNGTDPGTGLAGLDTTYFSSTVEGDSTDLVMKDDGSQEAFYDVTLDLDVFASETL